MKSKILQLFFLFFVIVLFTSCEDKMFKRTKVPDIEINSLSKSSFIKVKSYVLTYNPKSNGYIEITLEDGSKYTAKSVDGGSFSSINSLLLQSEVVFDTVRKEVVLNKFTKI